MPTETLPTLRELECLTTLDDLADLVAHGEGWLTALGHVGWSPNTGERAALRHGRTDIAAAIRRAQGLNAGD